MSHQISSVLVTLITHTSQNIKRHATVRVVSGEVRQMPALVRRLVSVLRLVGTHSHLAGGGLNEADATYETSRKQLLPSMSNAKMAHKLK